MSRHILVTLTVCSFFALAFVFAAPQQTKGTWDEVQTAIANGQPKSAIASLKQIEERAVDEKRYAEAVKAIAMKISMEGTVQGGKPEEKITRMRAEIKTAPEPMRPMMEAIVANWFWHYLQQNRWRFMQRTQTSEPPSDDFTTWDLPRLLAEIDKQFDRVFENVDQLKSIPIEQYDILLKKGNAPDNYRPTLFDFIAYNALEFYASGEQVASRSQDAFEMSADSPVFRDLDAFLAWDPESTDEDSLTLRAINLYQQLVRFHLNDDDPSALLDADLSRLTFGYNQAFGEDKAKRYNTALRQFSQRHSERAIAARASYDLAQTIYGEDDFVEARKIAQEALSNHPDTVGGRRCFNLIQQIDAKSSRVVAERVWNDPRPMIDVHYRNVTKIYFRLVNFRFQSLVDSNRREPEALSQEQQLELLSRKPIREWSADLPPTDDYQNRIHSVPTPDDLPKGSYFLIASHNASFDETDNQVSFTEIWESDLSIVVRNHHGSALIDGFVLDAESGQPIAEADIEVWQRVNREMQSLPSIKTDRDGMFRIPGDSSKPRLLLVTKGDRRLSSTSYLQSYRNPPIRPSEQTRFFTDRAIYRPGQTIQYKGICINVDQTEDNYQAIPRRDLTVVFYDANGEEVERVKHRTNDYGSFRGSVTAPRDRLLGQMKLMVSGQPQGSVQVYVEEYMRPKFQVELATPDASPKLNESVTVNGSASAYTGASIDGATVRYRVVREIQYPVWWYWRNWWMPKQSESQEIAHGVTQSDRLGKFKIEFDAKPDLSVDKTSEPTFRFTVYADVTDRTGETRSDERSFNIGYTALSASISASDWLTEDQPAEMRVRTTTLDGEGQATRGTIRIHEVIQPKTVSRGPLSGDVSSRQPHVDPSKPDPTNPNSWDVGNLVEERPFETDGAGNFLLAFELASGMYRARLETADRFGKKVTAELPFKVIDPDAERLDLKIPNLYASPITSIAPGEEYLAVWGSGYESARAFIEVEHRGKLLQSFWTDPEKTQQSIRQLVNESMRGGFTVRTTMVRENRAYMESHYVDVPWTNKQLNVKWERIVSKLEPGTKETWTAIVTGNDAEARIAEMVATLYDASLDAYRDHAWPSGFGVFRRDVSNVHTLFENQPKNLRNIYQGWRVTQKDGSLVYRSFPPNIVQNLNGNDLSRRSPGSVEWFGFAYMDDGLGVEAAANASFGDAGAVEKQRKLLLGEETAGQGSSPNGNESIDLDNVPIRKNLNETAFFFPHLVSAEDGSIRMTFTMPEALTEWKFLGFAHDPELRSGLLTGSTITAKDLMVQPNPPRFLREGDIIEFTVKVTNQSPTHQTGIVQLNLCDARTGQSVDDALGNSDNELAFSVPSGESRSFAWRLNVPDGIGYLTYKAVGASGRVADGEEGYLPVLSRRVLVTESIQLPIRGEQDKTFGFEKLLKSADSKTLQHQSLTIQMTSNPSWYAVMALPYLMEYPHECAEQVFNRLYANLLARHIATSDPKIERTFAQWRGTPALDSPLEKNQDIKSVMLEETPWVREAKDESQARRNVGILFDQNRLNDETTRGLRKLNQMQMADGAWPWFPGGRPNDYITLYITTGFGRLRHLGVKVDTESAVRSISRLDAWATARYKRIKPEHREDNHLTTTIALYLYGRSFFLKDRPVSSEHQEAVTYWLGQAKEHWLKVANRQSQAHLAISLRRFGDQDAAKSIMRSIKERSVSDEEMGMYWRDTEVSWWWYRAPIETQAMMIEAFDEVMDDQQAVEECKVWMLKQKQTQDWRTTKATADAVYALLLRGSDLLASNQLVEVSMAGEIVDPVDVEAGTGYYQQRFVAGEIVPELGSIRVKKVDEGVAWGGVHWQYLEDISKISPHEGNPLELTKQLYVKQYTDKGPLLERVDGPIKVGDELVVRIVLRSDRDMEYLHLKDHRGSGTEPVNVLSQYKFQDGLAYYESTRDTASHFFIDYLPKGTYVFEYATRVQLKGEYQTGMASIECMYAPEFNSHSESLPIVVQ
ncbi:MAG: alpha-2-macroglobulin family protein [Planctomycetota bacterium]